MKITLAHGSGGKITHELIKDVFFRHLGNDILKKAEDSGVADARPGKMAVTTDSFVVKPVFFPGGDIGKLAVCGTVNDLAVTGASPKYITAGFIIEEGFSLEDLEKIVRSMAEWALKAGVEVIAGDTKVVEKGEADGIFINTSGVGFFEGASELSAGNIRPGDKVIITGTMGDHGIAVLSRRKGLDFQSDIKSDCAPLAGMLADVTAAGGVKFMRDPTRGGLATTLNEITRGTELGIVIEEEKAPVSGPVRSACELLGLDPLYVANEGKAVIVAGKGSAENIIAVLRRHEYGKDASVIGEVTREAGGRVCLRTRYGTARIIDMMASEQLPRIC